MNSSSRLLIASTFLVSLSVGAWLLVTSGATTHAATGSVTEKRSEETAQPDKGAATQPDKIDLVSDKPLASYQVELLGIAFETASKLPVEPHQKTRSRMQAEVAATCFELDQPRRALHYIENIADWRRGKGYADFAFYCAQHGDSAEAQRYLDRALAVAESVAKEETAQDWQVDRIRVGIAKARVLLGETSKADDLAAGAADFELSQLEALKTARLDAGAFDAEFEVLSEILPHASFDQTKGALESCAQLFQHFYGDVERRDRVEEKIKSSWAKLPLQIRIELMIELAESALAQDDRSKALGILEETIAIMESAPWLPEDHLALMARLAELRYRAGDAERARIEADATLALYQTEKAKIEGFRRGGALRPLAEAYRVMGDTRASLSVYKTLVEEGSLNPNARARAEDLSATCRSMALHRVEPDGDLHSRLRQIHEGLVDPW